MSSITRPRPPALTRLALLAAAAFLEMFGCSDEGTGMGYYPSDAPGAAGALYRPLRPTNGAAGSSGLDPTPGLDTGGAGGFSPGGAGTAGAAGRAGAGGSPGFGVAGTSGAGLDYGLD